MSGVTEFNMENVKRVTKALHEALELAAGLAAPGLTAGVADAARWLTNVDDDILRPLLSLILSEIADDLAHEAKRLDISPDRYARMRYHEVFNTEAMLDTAQEIIDKKKDLSDNDPFTKWSSS